MTKKTYVGKSGQKYAIELDRLDLEWYNELESFDRVHGTYLRFCDLDEIDAKPSECIEIKTMDDLAYEDNYAARLNRYDMRPSRDGIDVSTFVDVPNHRVIVVFYKGARVRYMILDSCPDFEYFYEDIIACEDRYNPIDEEWEDCNGERVSWENATPLTKRSLVKLLGGEIHD